MRASSGIRFRFARWLAAAAFGLVASGSLAACLAGEAKPAPKQAASTAAAECKRDADCVTVSDDCCGCSQGGKQRALAKTKRDEYEKARAKRCEGTMCTQMMSQDPSCSAQATCTAGKCTLTPVPADGAKTAR